MIKAVVSVMGVKAKLSDKYKWSSEVSDVADMLNMFAGVYMKSYCSASDGDLAGYLVRNLKDEPIELEIISYAEPADEEPGTVH